MCKNMQQILINFISLDLNTDFSSNIYMCVYVCVYVCVSGQKKLVSIVEGET